MKLLGYEAQHTLYKSDHITIYSGIHIERNEPVILKLTNKEYPTMGELTHIQKEYEITKRLNIPGIVRPISLEKYKNGYILVKEYFDGVVLRELIKQDRLSISECIEISVKIARIIGDIHIHKIIHKDIKSLNILVDQISKAVRVIDFDIATLLTEEYLNKHITDHLEGTLEYISPEQTGRTNRPVDYRTDFYSLGIVLYELFTQTLPFNSKDSAGLIHAHLAKIPLSPSQVNTKVPLMISMIIERLMAKNPEDRYQSIVGLEFDLERCRKEYQLTSHINSFPLGGRDFDMKFNISTQLYGRVPEIDAFEKVFASVSRGSKEILTVLGSSGIGKSSLIREFRRIIIEENGYFISGEFDRLKQDIPYKTLMMVFRQLVNQILTESEDAITNWKYKFLKAFDNAGSLLIEYIPELVHIIGPQQPPVAPQSPLEAENRFKQLIESFIAIVSSKEHPLVIRLDNLKWADSSTLELLVKLFLSSSIQHLLIIFSYNSDDDVQIPFSILNELKKSEFKINQIEIGPLNQEQVNAFLADTCKCQPSKILELAAILLKKTNGNPFFLKELIKSLYEEGLIFFDRDINQWEWDINGIQKVGICNNVVDLMANKIKSLSPKTQTILKYAACIGHQFDIRFLIDISGNALDSLINLLGESVQLGYIQPLNEEGRLLVVQGAEFITPENQHYFLNAQFEFLHNRIQLSVLSLMEESRKKQIHLMIGQQLRKRRDIPLEEDIYKIVKHLNYARDMIEDQNETLDLARLNLMAGKRSLQSSANQEAVGFLTICTSLLEDSHWQTHYLLAFESHLEFAKSLHIATQFDKAEEVFKKTIHFVQNKEDRLRVCNCQLILLINKGKYQDAISFGLKNLETVGYHLAEKPPIWRLVLEYFRMKFLFHSRNVKLLKQDAGQDFQADIILEFLNNVAIASFSVEKRLFLLLGFKIIQESFKKEKIIYSLNGFIVYSLFLCVHRAYVKGVYYGRLAIEIAERFKSPGYLARVFFFFGAYINHWKNSINENLSYLLKALRYSRISGDLVIFSQSVEHITYFLFFTGRPLEDLYQHSLQHLSLVEQTRYEGPNFALMIMQQFYLNMQNKTIKSDSFDTASFNETLLFKKVAKLENKTYLSWFLLLKTVMFYLNENYSQAMNTVNQIKPHIPFLRNSMILVEYYFYQALIAASAVLTSSRPERKKYIRLVKQNKRKLKRWSDEIPRNFSFYYLLIEAEYLRLTRKVYRAGQFYEEAITISHKNQSVLQEAIASMCAAKHYLFEKQHKFAVLYMTQAKYLFGRWNGQRKADLIDHLYTEFINQSMDFYYHTGQTSTQTNLLSKTSLTTQNRDVLNYNSIFKASQAIAAVLSERDLLQKLIAIIIESADAQKGVLVLKNQNDEKFYIEAYKDLTTQETLLMQSIPLLECDTIAISVVNYVIRTQDEIVFSDSVENTGFQSDAYIMQKKPKSILCTPIIYKNKLIGIIYLENNASSSIFSADRVQVVNLISAQAAISILNAQLYDNLRGEINDHKKAKAFLEAANRSKTQFLNTVSHELRTPIHAISGINEVLSKLPQVKADPALREPIELIQKSIQRLTSVIIDILALQEFDKKGSITASIFKIQDVLFDLSDYVKQLIGSRPIQFKLNNSIPSHLIIRTDREKLIQSIEKLVVNAVNFTQEGTIQLTAAISEAKLIFTVTDTGKGIDMKYLSKIFEPFMQIYQEMDRAVQGIGVGLAICKNNIELLGGELSVQSQIGQGSEFSFWIPYSPVENPLDQIKINKKQKKISLKSRKVLYCDDDPFNLAFMEMILKERLNYTGVADGYTAIELAKAKQFDLIFMDIQMPEIDGIHTMKEIRRLDNYKQIPIVALTAQVMPGDRDRFLKKGFDEYIAKPIKEEGIILFLKDLFR